MCLLVKVATLRLLVLYFIAGFFALYFIAIFTSTPCCCFCQWHDLHTDWRQVPGCGCNHRGRRSQEGKWEWFLLESPPPPACWQFSCKETQSFILFGFLLPPPPLPQSHPTAIKCGMGERCGLGSTESVRVWGPVLLGHSQGRQFAHGQLKVGNSRDKGDNLHKDSSKWKILGPRETICTFAAPSGKFQGQGRHFGCGYWTVSSTGWYLRFIECNVCCDLNIFVV